MDSLAQRHLGVKTIGYEEVAGKGAGQIGFDQVTLERATAVLGRGCRYHPAACIAGCIPIIEPTRSSPLIYRQIEMPVTQVLFDDGAASAC